jgi:hypothetical protein
MTRDLSVQLYTDGTNYRNYTYLRVTEKMCKYVEHTRARHPTRNVRCEGLSVTSW